MNTQPEHTRDTTSGATVSVTNKRCQSSSLLLQDIEKLIGQPQYPATASFAAELSYGWNTLAATQNGNPLYWDNAVADTLTGGFTLPASTLSLWMRPHYWSPGANGEQMAMQSHFDLKKRLNLPEAIMSDYTLVLGEPVRPADVISHHQMLRSVSEPKTTRLGHGRFWVIDVKYANQRGVEVGVESYTGFGYRRHNADTPRRASSGPSQTTTPGHRSHLSQSGAADTASVNGLADNNQPTTPNPPITNKQQHQTNNSNSPTPNQTNNQPTTTAQPTNNQQPNKQTTTPNQPTTNQPNNSNRPTNQQQPPNQPTTNQPNKQTTATNNTKPTQQQPNNNIRSIRQSRSDTSSTLGGRPDPTANA